MHHQGHGVRKPLSWFALANTGRYALVPPILLGLALPAGLLLVRIAGNPQLAQIYVFYVTTLFAPALAAWWPPFVFKERIEGDGRELLYLLRRNGEGWTALALALSHWLLLVPFVLVAQGIPGFTDTLALLLVARCLFVTALTFCAAFLLRSSAIALIVGLAFNLVLMTPLEGAFESQPAAITVALYVVLAAVLFVVGETSSRRFIG